MPDGWFYYSITIVLALAIITILWRYSNKIDTAIDKLTLMVNNLDTKSTLHDRILEDHDEEISDIKKIIHPVNYPGYKKRGP
jgi:hypothetical protein